MGLGRRWADSLSLTLLEIDELKIAGIPWKMKKIQQICVKKKDLFTAYKLSLFICVTEVANAIKYYSPRWQQMASKP